MVTPVRRQYLDIKNDYPDALVLFRLGDFYEAFDDDARVASRELEITLTSRSMGKGLKIPMAGVPAHALESYLVRLIKKGYKVAICEQLSDPATSKGLLERDVVRVVTPGTVLETALLDQNSNNYLVAVVQEGPLVGLAYVDASTGEFAATQTTPEKVHLELSRLDPAEILVPNAEQSPEGTLASLLPDLLPGTGDVYNFTELESAAFDYSLARDALLNYYGILSLESFGCNDLPLAVRAAGGIIHYLGHTYKTAAPKLSPLSVYSVSEFMVLDEQTRGNLELFRAGRQQSQRLSLLDTLDLTRTSMGGRLMRRWLGQPLLSLDGLNRRLDAVELFAQDAFLRSDIRSILAQIPDLERILARVQTGAVLPRELISLKTGLEGRDHLVLQLGGFASSRDSGGREEAATEGSAPEDSVRPPKGSANSVPLLLSNQLPAVTDLIQLIEAAMAPEPSASVGDGNVIREGFSDELDQLKRASGDARNFIASLESRERERTGIRGLKVGYNHVFGYYIEVSKANQEQVPQDYVRRQTLTNAERYVVPELKEYESLVLNARERIDQLERDLYHRLCAQIAEHAPVLGKLAAAIARLDVFAGWAEVAVNNSYVRPSLDQGNRIRIKDGRHPVVERVLPVGSFVPNDVVLCNDDAGDDARLLVITGPNMAGKSTFIRQTAIITLMAQVGSFVPAAAAHIGLVDRIFTRVGLQDDLSTGQSTFMVEMLETAAILNQATSRSLVILDEIGRGTSTYDGLSIARSVIEHLHNDPRLGCKTLFATHYHELTEVASMLPGVRNFSVAVTEEAGDVVFLHRIIPGGADRSYGVHVAQLAGLPPAVVSRAWEVLKELEKTGAAGQVSRKASLKTPRKGSSSSTAVQMPLFQPERPLLDEVLGLDIPNLTPLEAINKLYELQQKARES
ncbi:MAG: DNA mismatch repair protein MutS [Chloroflexi bacterium]|nr:DNA mismatch repair protein MutS [Chloroflexota bacterium]